MGLGYKTIMWLIPDALFLMVIIVANVGVVQAFVVSTVDVSEAEANLALHRLHFSQNGISETDIMRVYTGKLDPDRFTDDMIENALDYENVVMAIKLNLINTDETSVRPVYLNQDKYEKEWVKFVIGRISGKGFNSYFETKYVTFGDNTSKLESVVLMPR